MTTGYHTRNITAETAFRWNERSSDVLSRRGMKIAAATTPNSPRRAAPVVYVDEAAAARGRARAQYRDLGTQLLRLLEQERAGWFEDDPVPAAVRKIEIRSRMRTLLSKHGSDISS
jgi:hypothetical protein